MVSASSFELSNLIALRKKRAELTFKKGYLIWKDSPNKSLIDSISLELSSIEDELESLEKKLKKFDLVLPDQNKLDELNKELSSLGKEELYELMESKQGEEYNLLKERGELLKQVFENREEIAGLNIMINDLSSKEKKQFLSILRDRSKFSEESFLKLKDEKKRKKLMKLFSRLGFSVSGDYIDSEEKKIYVCSKPIWVPVTMLKKIEDLNKNLTELSKKIQLLNAQKQIKVFSENEEKEFESVQTKYLSLLKEQDSILHDFGEK